MTAITAISSMRAALAPLRNGSDVAPPSQVFDTDWLPLLRVEKLAPVWCELAQSRQVLVSDELRSELLAARRLATARYLLQRRAAVHASACLSAAHVAHVVFKGAAVREHLYCDPALRPAVDVDVLIAPDDRDAAIRALVQAQLRFLGSRQTISHEASLRDRYVTIDLHWALFRPGRGRCELTPWLLETARPRGPLCVLSDDAELLVTLVHPAFTKYVNGRAARLIRVVDLDRMLRAARPDWDWILSLIDAAGLGTAAWAVLHWQRTLMDTPIDPAVLRRLEPRRLQRRYLAYWIDHQLPARLGAIPGLVQAAFSLLLHEHAGDALRAMVQLAKARRAAGPTLRYLEGLRSTSE